MARPRASAAVCALLVLTGGAAGSAPLALAPSPSPTPLPAAGADVVCLLPACLERHVLALAFTALALVRQGACPHLAAACDPVGAALDAQRCAVRAGYYGEFGCIHPDVAALVPRPGGNTTASRGTYLVASVEPRWCPPLWWQDPAEEPVGLTGLCLLTPHPRTFTVAVHDHAGNPVAFRWAAITSPGGSCDWGDGAGTTVLVLRPHCAAPVVGVWPKPPALPGTIVVGPAPP